MIKMNILTLICWEVHCQKDHLAKQPVHLIHQVYPNLKSTAIQVG